MQRINRRGTFTFVLGLTLLLLLPMNGWVCNPPPPGPNGEDAKYIGPAIVGTVMLLPDNNNPPYLTKSVFNGYCQGKPISNTSWWLNELSFYTKETLEGVSLGLNYESLGTCLPNNQTPIDLVVANVSKFTATSEFVTADVVLLFVRY
jgi:hypothetical protein